MVIWTALSGELGVTRNEDEMRGKKHTPQKKCLMKMINTLLCLPSSSVYKLLKGREEPSTARIGSSAAAARSFAEGILSSTSMSPENSAVGSGELSVDVARGGLLVPFVEGAFEESEAVSLAVALCTAAIVPGEVLWSNVNLGDHVPLER